MSKILVSYISFSGVTKRVAEKLSEVTHGDLIEIKPVIPYTEADLNWNDSSSRSSIEMQDLSARPEIEDIENISDYDTIFIGYPIWWGTNPRIIETLLDTYNFDDKNVALFATSGGSGISQSERDLKAYNTKMNVLGSKLFNGSVTKTDVTSWVEKLGN